MAKKSIKIPRIGNLAAQSPLMRKGGVHIESKSSIRHKQKKKITKRVDEWYQNH